MKPTTYDRKNQETVRFYLDKETKQKLKILLIQEEKTIQEVLEEAAKNIVSQLEEE